MQRTQRARAARGSAYALLNGAPRPVCWRRRGTCRGNTANRAAAATHGWYTQRCSMACSKQPQPRTGNHVAVAGRPQNRQGQKTAQLQCAHAGAGRPHQERGQKA